MKVKIKLTHPNSKLPVKSTKGSACYDCIAVSMEENENVITYGLGFAIELPRGKQLDLRARSSIYKTGLILSNGIGTGDEDYRGEYQAKFYDLFPDKPNYEVGDRVVQIQIPGVYEIEWVVANELNDTKRGEGGFGSTGN